MTAKEFLRNKKSVIGLRSQSSPLGSEGNEIEVMIEFAKYHVQKVNEQAKNYIPDVAEDLEIYPLENIK